MKFRITLLTSAFTLSAVIVPAIADAAEAPAESRTVRGAAAPPPPPAVAVARDLLDTLEVAEPGSLEGYSRARFPHWVTIEGTCNTREIVLRRDGQNVTTDAECRAVSGVWESPYDGATWTDASDVDIDHMVPLAEAWRSGAASWSQTERRGFANDLESSQLWAVTDHVNQAKGDKDPARWRPPLRTFHCEYARSWIEVKAKWRLSVDASEKEALREMLGTC
ncbi:HNH endonuclease family protein [Thermostaphylospora chromogena]|uniref:GmrSD restriction endonucleases C-terminal domain-containing protein n=1 Tax=Thermostaphylospora chromogena TaxID=35622 RepID=A0A1H1GVR7_9ACTN|nr:HNH endonuclease family protein [Thermostaphylospora chromogena]SDR16988.1 Protein of unknown function [Thermostaphylospora chromogena]